MKRFLKYLSLMILFILIGCSANNEIKNVNLRNWNPDSENVADMQIIVEDDGDEHCPVILNNRYLVFESKKTDNSDLWYIDLSKKGGIVQLTNYDGPDMLPCSHPNGRNYIFLSNRGDTGFYMGELGKPTAVSLVEVREPYFGGWSNGDISSDGKLLLYTSGKYIWTFNLKNKIKTQFIQGTLPKWSPNNEKIIFCRVGKIIGNHISSSIWLMNNDGTEQTEIISGNDEFTYSWPSISPNGKKILYEKRKVSIIKNKVHIGNSDIWICDIDGTNHMQITTHPLNDQQPVWLDSNQIIFSSERPQSGMLKDKKWDIWKLTLSN